MYGRRVSKLSSTFNTRAGEMRQIDIEAAPTAMRSPNFWAGCSQDPAAINHWPRGNYIVLSNYSTTYQMVAVCLAVTVRSLFICKHM